MIEKIWDRFFFFFSIWTVVNTLATWCEELTHWKRLWCWEGLGAGGEGDGRGWDGWMASLTWWTWVWANSGSWWWTGRPGVLRFMGSQRVRHDWVTELKPCISNSSLGRGHKKLINTVWTENETVFIVKKSTGSGNDCRKFSAISLLKKFFT